MRVPRLSYLLRVTTNRQRASRETMRETGQVLAVYEVGRWQPINLLVGGRNSYNLLLETDRGRKVLKRYRWSLPTILGEHSILRCLNATDFPAPKLMPNRDGETCTELDGEYFALYEFIRGYRYDDFYTSPRLSRCLVAEAGKTLSRLHLLTAGLVPQGRKLEGFTPDGRRLWRDTGWHLDALEEVAGRIHGNSTNALDILVSANLGRLRNDLAELGHWHERIHPQLRKTVIHRDYVAKNITFIGKRLAGVLDFGSAGLDLRALDIARALQSFARRGRDGLDVSSARVFLQAYRTGLSMADDEVALIPKLLRWQLLRTIVWRLGEDLPIARQAASFRERWEKAGWLEANGDRFVESLLEADRHPLPGGHEVDGYSRPQGDAP